MQPYLIFYSQNELNLENIKDECIKEQWMAVASYDIDSPKIIYFDIFSTAKDFIKRNFNKSEMIGLINIPEDEFKRLKEKHSFECLSFPKKINNINIEVIEIQTEIELRVHYKKVC